MGATPNLNSWRTPYTLADLNLWRKPSTLSSEPLVQAHVNVDGCDTMRNRVRASGVCDRWSTLAQVWCVQARMDVDAQWARQLI